MNKDMMMMVVGATSSTPSDLQLCPASPDAQEIIRPSLHPSDVSVQPITTVKPHQQNPRKKRTKMIRLQNSKAIVGLGHPHIITKTKPDPSAPKITPPCTECGKRFWSWKALFGHMRCHPERPWRGINPPPNLHHSPLDQEDLTNVTTEEDEYAAACLLMLANGPSLPESIHAIGTATIATHTATSSYQHHHQSGLQDTLGIHMGDPLCRFECSSCKKVFGSHQALGGHRASHKNVKGCFAITRNDSESKELEDGELVSHYDQNGEEDNMVIVPGSSRQQQQQHRCSICSRIFSSGQALGGHKRCHWDKEDGVLPTSSTSLLSQGHTPSRFDLNLPAPLEDNDSTSGSDLDLRLGL